MTGFEALNTLNINIDHTRAALILVNQNLNKDFVKRINSEFKLDGTISPPYKLDEIMNYLNKIIQNKKTNID